MPIDREGAGVSSRQFSRGCGHSRSRSHTDAREHSRARARETHARSPNDFFFSASPRVLRLARALSRALFASLTRDDVFVHEHGACLFLVCLVLLVLSAVARGSAVGVFLTLVCCFCLSLFSEAVNGFLDSRNAVSPPDLLPRIFAAVYTHFTPVSHPFVHTPNRHHPHSPNRRARHPVPPPMTR